MKRTPFAGGRASGFSLVELMIVVAIIGILSMLAVPKFQNFQAKARQSEAKNNLSHIYTLQMSYYGDNDRFAAMPSIGNATGATTGSNPGFCNRTNDIGFRLTDCYKVRYDYAATTAGAAASEFTATATSGAGAQNKIKRDCPQDVWRIDHNKRLVATSDTIAECDE